MFSSDPLPWKSPSAATHPMSFDLIYLFKEGMEGSGEQ